MYYWISALQDVPLCLFIKNKIFTIDSIADFINERFVSVDYTEGSEKKRLSKIYEVYTEPVLLICDANGKVMHRMEGKNVRQTRGWPAFTPRLRCEK